jgi:hypothetical protein
MQLTSGRLAAVVIGIPILLVTAVFGAFNLVGTFARTSEHHTATYVWPGGAISLKTSAGDVHIQTGTGTQVVVAYTEHYELRKPTVTATTSNGGLQLIAKCPGGVFDNNCEVNYVVTVPASAALVLHTGDGDVQFRGTTSTVSVDTGNGGIDGTQLGSKTVNASTGDGDVHLQWDVAPAGVVATTGNGGIGLIVPKGSGPYRVSAHTGNGGTDVTVPTDQSAPASITAETGDGGIQIVAAG